MPVVSAVPVIDAPPPTFPDSVLTLRDVDPTVPGLIGLVEAEIAAKGGDLVSVARSLDVSVPVIESVVLGRPVTYRRLRALVAGLGVEIAVAVEGETVPFVVSAEKPALDLRCLIRQQLRRLGVSAVDAGRRSGLPHHVLPNVLGGSTPNSANLVRICAALKAGLVLVRPGEGRAVVREPRDLAGREPRDGAGALSAVAARGASGRFDAGSARGAVPGAPRVSRPWNDPACFTRFSGERSLPVKLYREVSQGWGRGLGEAPDAPAPVDFDDPCAFYVVAPDRGLAKAFVNAGDYCLVAPHARFTPGALAWFRLADGREGLRWCVCAWPRGYDVVIWSDASPSGSERLRISADYLHDDDVHGRGVVLAVYRGRPAVADPPPRARSWPSVSLAPDRQDAIATAHIPLWRRTAAPAADPGPARSR